MCRRVWIVTAGPMHALRHSGHGSVHDCHKRRLLEEQVCYQAALRPDPSAFNHLQRRLNRRFWWGVHQGDQTLDGRELVVELKVSVASRQASGRVAEDTSN